MSEQLQPLLKLLEGQFGWLATVVTWWAAIKLPLAFVASWLQARMTKFCADVQASPETDDDELVDRVLGARWYRFTAYALDAVLSFRLPTRQSLDWHWQEKLTASQETGKSS